MSLTDAPAAAVEPVVDSGLTAMTRKSALFAVGAVAGKLVGLVMLPILTRTLMPSELGNLDVLMVLINALIVALLLGLDVAALRLYFDQPDAGAKRTLMATWYLIALTATVGAGTVLMILSGELSTQLFSDPRLGPAFLAAAIAVIAGTVQVVVLTALRAQGRAGWYAAISVGTLALYAVLATVLLNRWRADPVAVVSAWAIALVVTAVAGTVMLRRQILGRPSARSARGLLRLGLPLAPAVVGMLIAEFLIRIILLRTAGPDQVAYFTVGNRFASVATLSLAVLQLAWVPRAYALGQSGPARARMGTEVPWIVAIVCVAVLVIAGGARAMVELVAGETYLLALPALGFSLVGVVGAAVYLVSSMRSALSRRTEDLAVSTGAAAITAIIGTALLAPTLGATGTSAAMALGQWLAVVIVSILGLRRLDIPTDRGRIAITALATCAATLVMVTDAPLLIRVVVATGALMSIAACLPLRQGLATIRRGLR